MRHKVSDREGINGNEMELTFLLKLKLERRKSVPLLVSPAMKNLDQSHTFTCLSFPPEIMNFPLSPNVEKVLIEFQQISAGWWGIFEPATL